MGEHVSYILLNAGTVGFANKFCTILIMVTVSLEQIQHVFFLLHWTGWHCKQGCSETE